MRILLLSSLFLGLTIAPATAQSLPPAPSAIDAPTLRPLLPPAPTPIAPSTLTPISQQQANRYAQAVPIFAGRNSAIEFRTGERIQFLQLSDPSLMVFSTNAPVESGQASVIILRLIRPLRFPGVITTPAPNLTVTTNQGTYFFNLVPSYQSQPNTAPSGVAIVPGSTMSFASAGQTTIATRQGQATADDVRRGLRVAIRQGFTTQDDPIVDQVQQAIGLMQRGTPLPEIASVLAAPSLPTVLVVLGGMGIEEHRNNFAETPVEPGELSPELSEPSVVPVPPIDIPVPPPTAATL